MDLGLWRTDLNPSLALNRGLNTVEGWHGYPPYRLFQYWVCFGSGPSVVNVIPPHHACVGEVTLVFVGVWTSRTITTGLILQHHNRKPSNLKSNIWREQSGRFYCLPHCASNRYESPFSPSAAVSLPPLGLPGSTLSPSWSKTATQHTAPSGHAAQHPYVRVLSGHWRQQSSRWPFSS